MYLLTGEVYVIIKKLVDRATWGGVPHVSGGWNLTQNTLVVPSPHSETGEKNEEKILEITKKIIALLTREVRAAGTVTQGLMCLDDDAIIAQVPMRSQDVTVYFSMEEWEYLEGHKDLYEDVMMEDHQTLASPSKRAMLVKGKVSRASPSYIHHLITVPYRWFQQKKRRSGHSV
ncbi:hypothetical protein GDO78_018761 [Eleutherodactylus coqui]|uniref:KRAB domain-containing protein n=1 Tax=Eleutherodactylus coqui TaxID=57060 RepID=A0A8J6E357_ELECQ|nr:hypothetical protein GDO78_018761 [Eleutherodactylus coqui]